MTFKQWRSWATLRVIEDAARVGWLVLGWVDARTGTRYVRLWHPSGMVAAVRLSDHRPGRFVGDRTLSVRQAADGRLGELRGFLHRLHQGRKSRAS